MANPINSFVGLTHLIDHIDPDNESEVNLLEHYRYYNDTDFIYTLTQSHHKLNILIFNSQSINAKFDQLKLFLAQANTTNLISIITLQEFWCDSKTDMNFFNLQGYIRVYEFSRLSKHGGLITYIHNSCSYVKSDIEINLNLFESSLIEVYQLPIVSVHTKLFGKIHLIVKTQVYLGLR